MWSFSKSKPSTTTLIKEIDLLAKSLQDEIMVETQPLKVEDSAEKQFSEFIKFLGAPNESDKAVFQTIQLNFSRAVARHKHDESKLIQILQDWRESLSILRVVLNGDEEKYPQMKLSLIEIERRLKSDLGNDYQDPNEAIKNLQKSKESTTPPQADEV